jgi:hypothetical protein
VLSLGTVWGLIHQRWVLTKFAITLAQLYAGIVLLSAALADIAVGTAVGFPTPVPLLLSVAAAVLRRRALRAPDPPGRRQIGHTAGAIRETRP